MNPILRREMLLHQLAELMKVRATNPEKYDPQIDEICKKLPRYDVPDEPARFQLTQPESGWPDPHASDRSVTGKPIPNQWNRIGDDTFLFPTVRTYDYSRYNSWHEDH